MHHFSPGENKIWQNIEKSQNIPKMIAALQTSNQSSKVNVKSS